MDCEMWARPSDEPLAREYKEASIISGTSVSIWSKLTLSLLSTITLEVVFFQAYAPFPELLLFSKRILQAMFCEGVQHCP
jgi:hypothetical protein